MKKLNFFITAFCCAALLAACGGKIKESSETMTETVKEGITKEDAETDPQGTVYVAPVDVDMETLKGKMLDAAEDLPEMSCVYGTDNNASDLFAYLAAYGYDNVEDYFFAYAGVGGRAEEIAVVKLKRSKDAPELKKALEKHIKTRTEQFETYEPSQVELAKSAGIETAGNYVALITCKNSDGVKKAFTDMVK